MTDFLTGFVKANPLPFIIVGCLALSLTSGIIIGFSVYWEKRKR